MNVIDCLSNTPSCALARKLDAGFSIFVLLMQVIIITGFHRRTQCQLMGKSIWVQRLTKIQVKYLEIPYPAGSECRIENTCHVLEMKMHTTSDLSCSSIGIVTICPIMMGQSHHVLRSQWHRVYSMKQNRSKTPEDFLSNPNEKGRGRRRTKSNLHRGWTFRRSYFCLCLCLFFPAVFRFSSPWTLSLRTLPFEICF